MLIILLSYNLLDYLFKCYQKTATRRLQLLLFAVKLQLWIHLHLVINSMS